MGKKYRFRNGKWKEGTFKCQPFCGYATDNQSHIQTHVQTVHRAPTELFCSFPGCNFAPKRQQLTKKLKSHQLIHEEQPEKRFPFPCRFAGCDFRTNRKIEIKKHEREHTISKTWFTCEFCPNRYPRGPALAFHKRIRHGGEFYSNCSLCGYQPLQGGVFGYHMKMSHNGKKLNEDSLVMRRPSSREGAEKNGREGGLCAKNSEHTFQDDLCDCWVFNGPEATLRHSAVVFTSPAVLLQKIIIKIP